MEFYAGYGFGNSRGPINDIIPTSDISGNYNVLFGQINIGKTGVESPKTEFAFGIKLASLDTNLKERNVGNNNSMGSITSYGYSNFFIEPVFMIRTNGKGKERNLSIKLGGTIFLSPETFSEINYYFPYFFANISFDLHYHRVPKE